MRDDYNILGIDVGSTAAAAAEVDSRGEVIRSAYDFHAGDPAVFWISRLGGSSLRE